MDLDIQVIIISHCINMGRISSSIDNLTCASRKQESSFQFLLFPFFPFPFLLSFPRPFLPSLPFFLSSPSPLSPLPLFIRCSINDPSDIGDHQLLQTYCFDFNRCKRKPRCLRCVSPFCLHNLGEQRWEGIDETHWSAELEDDVQPRWVILPSARLCFSLGLSLVVLLSRAFSFFIYLSSYFYSI